MKRGRLSKQNIILLVIVALIVILVIILCIGSAKRKQEAQIQTTKVITTTIEDTEPSKLVDDDGNDATPHMSKDGKKMMEGDHLATFEGVAESTIDGKKGMYYFSNATYDPTFTGLATGPNNKWYYIKKGKWDKSFTGFISLGYYLRYIKNGMVQSDFNGTFYLDKYDKEGNPIKNGAVYGFEMGRDDNWQFPLHNWYVKAN